MLAPALGVIVILYFGGLAIAILLYRLNCLWKFAGMSSSSPRNRPASCIDRGLPRVSSLSRIASPVEEPDVATAY